MDLYLHFNEEISTWPGITAIFQMKCYILELYAVKTQDKLFKFYPTMKPTTDNMKKTQTRSRNPMQ